MERALARIAFLLILYAIFDKNRDRPTDEPS
jgi:hypothetical protein